MPFVSREIGAELMVKTECTLAALELSSHTTLSLYSQWQLSQAGPRMSSVFRIMAGIQALVFVGIGLSWWIAPSFAVKPLGMELLSGTGLSSQIADLAAFFLTLGGAILIGLAQNNRIWLYPPIMLLSFAIIGRLAAWAFHDASLAIDLIAVEAVGVAILIFNVRALLKQSA